MLGYMVNVQIICYNILILGKYFLFLREQCLGYINFFDIYLSKMNENMVLEWYCLKKYNELNTLF